MTRCSTFGSRKTKIMKLYMSFLCLLLFLGAPLFGQSVDLRFVPSESSTETVYCVNIQINGQDGADYIGISTIRFGYNPDVIRFSGNTEDVTQGSYTSINFDSNQQDLHPDCETPFGFNPYSSHSIDGLAPGDVLITMALLNATPPSGSPVFACPAIESTWIDVSEVCFEVLDAFADPEFQFMGVEDGDASGESTGTNFNTHFNNPNTKYLNGTFNPLNTPFVDILEDSLVVCIFEDPLELPWIQDLITNGTPCEVDQINMFDFEGETYFEVVPNFGGPMPLCPADFPINYYDCEGVLLCVIGNLPPGELECPDGLVAATSNDETIFQYLAGCTNECALNYNENATEDNGSCEYPDCDDNNVNTIDSFDAMNCECINEPVILNCPTSDFNNPVLELLCSGDVPTFPTNFTISDPEGTQVGTVEWYDGTNVFTDNVVSELFQTQIGCSPSSITTVYAFVGCDSNSDGIIDEYIQVAEHQFQVYPAIQSPTISGPFIDMSGNCMYTIDPACPDDLLDITSFVLSAGDSGGMLTVVPTSVFVENPCAVQAFDFVYDGCAGGSGCTDPCAPNFDPIATIDDGSCQPYDDTCDADICTNGGIYIWDATACECVLETATIEGCTDAIACNFDATANCDDGSCAENDCEGECGGTAVSGSPCDDGDPTTTGEVWDINCACVGEAILGCTDPCAENYDPNATVDTGCIYPDCEDDCEFIIGQFDLGLCECVYYEDTIAISDDCPLTTEIFDSLECEVMVVVSDVSDGCDLTIDFFDAANCQIINEPPSCDDANDNTTDSFDLLNCECINDPMLVEGCTDPCAPNYNADAVLDDGSCDAYDTTCDTDICTNGGSYIWDMNTCTCILETATVLGCMDPTAENYNADANCEAGIDCIMVSIESIAFDPISISPNPASYFVSFRFEPLTESSNLYFYNVVGKMVKMEALEKGIQEQTIFLQDFPSGIYFWKINGVGGKLVVK